MEGRALSRTGVTAAVSALRPVQAMAKDVSDTVARLLADVRTRGDAALVEATARLDWPGASAAALQVSVEDIESAHRAEDPNVLGALETSRDNCTFFHEHELIPDWEDTGPQGQKLGIRHQPVARAGLYVPGGLGAYASTVIMNAVPARVAGVEQLIVCTPPGRDGGVNRSVLAAARLMGIERVFRIGGAQAIAAMAFGTETVPRVDVICGPGNAYVMEAKRQVYGAVGVDNLAGPSEVLIVAGRSAPPEWVAADLLAQEEHGSGASAVLMAESEGLCRDIAAAIRNLLGLDADRSRRLGSRIAAFYPAPGEDFFDVAAELVNVYAPEHLEIQIEDPRRFLPRVRSAGAVFIGRLTATAFGDYVAGSNHVLPTGGSARFSSPLSVAAFIRRSSIVEMSGDAVQALTPWLARLADSEGFVFHRMSAELRAGGREAG